MQEEETISKKEYSEEEREEIKDIESKKKKEENSMAVKNNDKNVKVTSRIEGTLPAIPILRLDGISEKLVERRIDKDIPDIVKRRTTTPIPYIKLGAPITDKPITQLNKDIPDIVSEMKKKRIVYPINTEQEEESERCTVKEAMPSGSGNGDKIPDIFELIFNDRERSRYKIRSKGQKVILFLDSYGNSYINLLEELLTRIYKEIDGGEPRIKVISKYDEFWKEYVEKYLNSSNMIIRIDLDYKENGKDGENDKNPWLNVDDIELKDRFDELYTGGVRFIIFRTSLRNIFEEYKKKLESIHKKINYRFDLIKLEAKELPASFANIIWGYALEGDLDGKFDEVFNKAKKVFRERLNKIKEDEGGLFKLVTNRWKSNGSESDLHYNIKVFIVSLLVNELRKKGESLTTLEDVRKRIKTEGGNREAVPDIQIDKEVYEVETLFGEGEDADKKIDEIIDKYRYSHDIQKINVVMDNLGFLMHLKDLQIRRKHFKNIEFYTLDVKNKRLISLNEFIKDLKKAEVL